MTTVSLDGAVTPQAFLPRTRTKYVPAPTPVTVSVVAVPPVSKFARSASPLDDPASTMYDVVGPTLGFHCSVTVDPPTAEANPFGGAGGPEQGSGPPPSTSSVTSFDVGPT